METKSIERSVCDIRSVRWWKVSFGAGETRKSTIERGEERTVHFDVTGGTSQNGEHAQWIVVRRECGQKISRHEME